MWHEVQPDSGPHLGRLPDELLPAIGKFIIVARDACETQGTLDEEAIEQVAILVDCLVIVCRHFDNILAVIKYEYKPNLIAILSRVFKQVCRFLRHIVGLIITKHLSMNSSKWSCLKACPL